MTLTKIKILFTLRNICKYIFILVSVKYIFHVFYEMNPDCYFGIASSLWIRSQLSICSKPVDNLLETCYIKPGQVMRTHHDIGLMTEACNRLAANYAFLAVYSHIIIINVRECCVNYIKMLMQLTSITVINILTMFVSQFAHCYYIWSYWWYSCTACYKQRRRMYAMCVPIFSTCNSLFQLKTRYFDL